MSKKGKIKSHTTKARISSPVLPVDWTDTHSADDTD